LEVDIQVFERPPSDLSLLGGGHRSTFLNDYEPIGEQLLGDLQQDRQRFSRALELVWMDMPESASKPAGKTARPAASSDRSNAPDQFTIGTLVPRNCGAVQRV